MLRNDPQNRPGQSAPAVPRAHKATSTRLWVWIGAAWMVLFVYAMTAWVLGPDFVPNTFGRDQAPPDYVRFIRGLEIAMVLLTVWLFYFFIIRGWRRTGEITFDGMFFLACGTLVVQEPWLNWIRPQLLYNTIFFNMGSWLGTLPFISSPVAQKVPVSLAFAYLGYFWIVAAPAWCGSRLMGWISRRRPDMSALKLIGCGLLAFIVFDLAIESFILRTEMFIYPSTIPWLTLFPGTTHQLPIYETLHWAGTYTMLASVHFFRNDRGETWADRNFASLRTQGRREKFLRWLAIVGLCQTGMLLVYNVPYMVWALHGGKFTVTEESRPWLTAGLCGTSTPYDCPGPGVLIPRRDSPTNRIAPAPQSAAPTAADQPVPPTE